MAAVLVAVALTAWLVTGPMPAHAQSDTTPPTRMGTARLAADGKTLTIPYNEDLDESSVPPTTAFSVRIGVVVLRPWPR